MAQLALTVGGAIAGGIAGSFAGNPLLGAQLGALAGSIIGGIFFPQGSTTPGPVVGDLRVQAATYGKPMPILAGTSRVAGEIIAMSELVPTAVDTSVGGGLGFGTPQQGVAGYTYSITMAVSFGKPLLGPAAAITRIWADGKKIYDKRPNGSRPRAGLRGATLRRYLGSDTQLPDPWMQAKFGADITPAYRGQVYIVLENLQLADFANHPPNITAEVVCQGSPAYPYIEITPGGGSNFEDCLCINYDLGIVVKTDVFGAIVVVDTQTGATIAGPTNVVQAVPGPTVFGQDGYLYIGTDVYGGSGNNYTKWTKIDPMSLEVVGSLGFDSATDDANHDGLYPADELKCRPNTSGALGYPYLLASRTSLVADGCVIVSTGQLEALASGVPVGGNLPMRFVARTKTVPDAHADDWEIDALSIAQSGASVTFDVWGCDGTGSHCYLYHYQVTDNLGPGGGLVNGGAAGANPITLIETIDISSAWSPANPGQALLSYTDDGDHALIISRGGYLVKFNLDSKTVTGAQLNTGLAFISPRTLAQGPSEGLLYCGGFDSASIVIVDVINWDISETVTLGNFVGGLTAHNPQWDDRNGTLWINSGSNLFELTLDVVVGTFPTVGQVVQGLCELGGLTSGQLDVSLLTQSLYGYAVGRQMSIKDAIKPLADAFLFEAYEADFKLKFAPLGSSTIAAALALADIGAHTEGSRRPEPLTITDTNQRQLPRRVTVKYINPDPLYQDGLQAAQRHQALVSSVGELALDVPVVMPNDNAADVANAWLARAWVNARKFASALTAKFLALTPTDVITVTDQYGATWRMNIKQINAGADGTFGILADQEDAESYVAPAPFNGATLGWSPALDLPKKIGHTDAELMDIVLIGDAQNGEGFYLAMASDTGDPDSWLGGVLMVSVDGGVSFHALETVVNAAAMGRATTPLATPPGGRWTTWDRVNSVTVRLFDPADDALASASEINVLNGANLCVLGNELIAFATAVDNGDGTFTISDLLRGLRGSDPFIGTHVAGERFVMVDLTKWRNIMPDPSFAVTRIYKTQSIGDTTIPATSTLFTDTGVRLKPLSPQGPAIAASGSDLVITWNRRTRIGGENEWGDAISTTPLGEATEAYQVDIIKSGLPVRTYSSSSPTVTYLAADQVTDFGSHQHSVEVEIYQMSAIVGRGFGLDAVLSLP